MQMHSLKALLISVALPVLVLSSGGKNVANDLEKREAEVSRLKAENDSREQRLENLEKEFQKQMKSFEEQSAQMQRRREELGKKEKELAGREKKVTVIENKERSYRRKVVPGTHVQFKKDHLYAGTIGVIKRKHSLGGYVVRLRLNDGTRISTRATEKFFSVVPSAKPSREEKRCQKLENDLHFLKDANKKSHDSKDAKIADLTKANQLLAFQLDAQKRLTVNSFPSRMCFTCNEPRTLNERGFCTVPAHNIGREVITIVSRPGKYSMFQRGEIVKHIISGDDIPKYTVKFQRRHGKTGTFKTKLTFNPDVVSRRFLACYLWMKQYEILEQQKAKYGMSDQNIETGHFAKRLQGPTQTWINLKKQFAAWPTSD